MMKSSLEVALLTIRSASGGAQCSANGASLCALVCGFPLFPFRAGSPSMDPGRLPPPGLYTVPWHNSRQQRQSPARVPWGLPPLPGRLHVLHASRPCLRGAALLHVLLRPHRSLRRAVEGLAHARVPVRTSCQATPFPPPPSVAGVAHPPSQNPACCIQLSPVWIS